MNAEQITAIQCAFADLQGAYQAYEQGNMHLHDWKAHALTIQEMSEQFSFLDELLENEQ